MQCRPYITAASERCRTSRTPTTTERTRARAHRATLLFTNATETCATVVLCCCDRRRVSRRHVPEPAREEALDVPPGAGQVPLPGRRQEGQQVRQPGLVQFVHFVEGLDGGQEEAGAGGQVDALWRRERAAARRRQRPSRRSRSPGAATVQTHCFETPGRHCHLTIRKAIPKDTDDDGVCRKRDNVRCGQR